MYPLLCPGTPAHTPGSADLGLKSLVASALLIPALPHAHCEPASNPVAGDTGGRPLSEHQREPSLVAELLPLCSHTSGDTVVILIVRMPVHLTAFLFFFPMICTLIFSLGMSLILSSVNVFFRDVGHLYSVWTVAWMYLTPVIYPVEVLPERLLPLMKFNPMFHYVTYFRDVVMYGTIPNLNSHLICLLFAFSFLGIGLALFKKQQDRFILYI